MASPFGTLSNISPPTCSTPSCKMSVNLLIENFHKVLKYL